MISNSIDVTFSYKANINSFLPSPVIYSFIYRSFQLCSSTYMSLRKASTAALRHMSQNDIRDAMNNDINEINNVNMWHNETNNVNMWHNEANIRDIFRIIKVVVFKNIYSSKKFRLALNVLMMSLTCWASIPDCALMCSNIFRLYKEKKYGSLIKHLLVDYFFMVFKFFLREILVRHAIRLTL